VTVYVAGVVEEQERVDVWEAPRTMLVGVSVQVNPVGDTELVSATVPVKLLTGETVIVEVPAVPAVAVTVAGLALTAKFGAGVTVKVTVAV